MTVGDCISLALTAGNRHGSMKRSGSNEPGRVKQLGKMFATVGTMLSRISTRGQKLTRSRSRYATDGYTHMMPRPIPWRDGKRCPAEWPKSWKKVTLHRYMRLYQRKRRSDSVYSKVMKGPMTLLCHTRFEIARRLIKSLDQELVSSLARSPDEMPRGI